MTPDSAPSTRHLPTRHLLTRHLLTRHLSSRPLGSLVLGVLVAVSVAALTMLPHALTALADDELRYEIAQLEALRADVNASALLGHQATRAVTADGIFGATDEAVRAVPGTLAEPLGDVMGDASWIAELRPEFWRLPTAIPGVSPELRLTIDLTGSDRVTYVDGAAPTVWKGNVDDRTSAGEPLEVAISQLAAEKLRLAVGDEATSAFGPIRVSGIFTPVDAADGYWAHAADLLTPVVVRQPGSPETVIVSALIDPLSARGLGRSLDQAELRVWYPTQQSALQYAQTDALLHQIQQLSTVGVPLPNGERLAFQTGLTAAIEGVQNHVSTLTALLALAGSAPLGVVLAALVLGIRAVVLKRQPALDLLVARGASTADARRVLALEGAVIAIPAAIAGVAVAALVAPIALADGSAALLGAAGIPAVFALSMRREIGAGRAARTDLQVRGRSPLRWIVEVLIVGVAIVAYVLLARRGLASAATVGVDPLLAVTPLVLALAACVVVMRVYPLPLLAYQRSTRRRRGAVGLVGSARAVREPAIGIVSVVAMLVGVSTAVSSLVLAATVTAGLDAGARTEVGADVRVTSAQLSGDTIAALENVAGVTSVAPLQYVATVDVKSTTRVNVTVIFADTAALHSVRPELPAQVPGQPMSVVASADLASDIAGTVTVEGQSGVLDGFVAPDALPDVTGDWVLIDAAYVDAVVGSAFAPTTALIAANETVAAAIERVVPADATVLDTAVVLAERSARPSVAGLRAALAAAIALAALMAAITVALAAVASAPARNRLMGVGHILGMSRRQLRRIVAWEIAPVAVTAIAVGVAVGLGLPFLIVGVVDLRAVIGGLSPVVVTIPWLVVALGVAGFGAVIATAGAISIGVARRVDPARQLRMGTE
jgi:putative ABC transport system permease protein